MSEKIRKKEVKNKKNNSKKFQKIQKLLIYIQYLRKFSANFKENPERRTFKTKKKQKRNNYSFKQIFFILNLKKNP